MTKIVAWFVVNNELIFLKDLVSYHLEFIDVLYFLDTGSNDGSLEFLRSQQSDRVIVEKYHTSYIPEYDRDWLQVQNPFPEVEVRNYALSQVEKLGADWLIQIDGDEIFLPKTREIIECAGNYSVIGHSTINPVEKLENHPKERRAGKALYDPHARIWRPNKGFRYIQNPAMSGRQFHCIPAFGNKHLYHHPAILFTDEPIHFHLHWMYGPKVEGFFRREGVMSRKEIESRQTNNRFSEICPELFWQRRKEWFNE